MSCIQSFILTIFHTVFSKYACFPPFYMVCLFALLANTEKIACCLLIFSYCIHKIIIIIIIIIFIIYCFSML